MKLYRESRRYREMKFKIGIIVFSFPFFFIEIRNAEGGGGFKIEETRLSREWKKRMNGRIFVLRINRRFNALRYYSPSLVILFFESDWTDCNWH